MPAKQSLPVINNNSCKHGLVREQTCDLAEPLLLNSGLGKLQPCSNCSMVASLETLNLVNKDTALAFMQRLGLHTPPKTRIAEVVCPVHEQSIVSDCALSECAFSTTYPGVRNCILVYMHKHKVDSLGPLDLSMILGQPHKDITDNTNYALKLLRQESVETTTTFELEAQFFVIKAKVCCACDSPITDSNKYSSFSGFYYCSSACALAKPEAIMLLEAASGVSISKILVWARNKYLTPLAFQQALGLDLVLLDSLVMEYFGISYSELYTSYTPPELGPLAKRLGRNPTWLKGFSDRTQSIQDTMVSKYGPIHLDFVSLQQELDSSI